MSEIGGAGGHLGGDLDLGALLRGIGRAKWWIIGTTLAAVALTFVIVSTIKPRYTGEAKVLLENQESYFTRPGRDTVEQQPTLDPEAVQSQVQLVTSRDLARQAVHKLDLLGNPEFDPLAEGMSPLTRLLVLLGLERDPREMSPEDRVLEAYFDRLTVYPVAKTRVLQIEFVSRDPDFAAKAANAIAELYIAVREDAKQQNAKAASAWLAPNIDSLRAKVAEAEAKVAAFRARSGLLIGSNNTTITAQQLSDMSTQLANARSAQADAQAKARLIRELLREGRVSEVSDVANNELIRGIAQQRVTLRAQLALESRTLLPGHPRIQELTAQLANVDNALRAAAEKAARGLENDARIAGARVDALTASLDAQKRTAATGNDDEVQLRALERDATAAREQLESFMQKYREATARNEQNAAPADARIISRAIAPQLPSFPKKVPMLVIGALAGFLLSFGLVVTRELLSGRAHVAPALRGTLQPAPAETAAPPAEPEPSVVSTPAVPALRPAAGPERTVEEALPEHAAIARLAEHIEAGKRDGEATCVLVCGVDRGSGSTTAAVELARSLAHDGRAILIDFDAEGPGLNRFVSDGEAAGLAELVAGEQTFTDVIHRDRGSRLHILPAGQARSEPADAERLSLVIEALVATYDYIVLDGSPLADSDSSLDLAAWTDLAVLVVAGNVRDLDTRVAVDTLVDAGAVEVQVLGAEGESRDVHDELDAA